MRRFLCILSFLICSFSSFGQEDFHYILGAEELSGIDIYGINQSEDRIYWIATNKGIYSFDGYNFEKYENAAQKSSSLFSPKIDYNGDVFAHNLSGQIFKVSGGELLLVHTVPDSLQNSYISFDFLPNNEMVINARKCYRVKADGIDIISEILAGGSFTHFSRSQNGNLLFMSHIDSITEVSGNWSKTKWYPATADEGAHLLMMVGGRFVANESNKKLYLIDSLESGLTLQPIFEAEQAGRIYTTSSHFWFANNTYGGSKFGLDDIEDSSKIRFSDYFISYVFEDLEKNTLLGTFGNGIVVIPPTHMKMISWPRDSKISQISSNGQNGLFLGSTNGQLFEWSNGLYEKLTESSAKQIEVLEFFPELNQLVSDRNVLSILEVPSYHIVQHKHDGPLKDVVFVGNHEFAIGSNISVSKIDSRYPNKRVSRIEVGRTSSLEFNPSTNELIVATSLGLIRMDSSEHFRKISFENGSYLVNDIEFHNGTVLVATQKFGILEQKGDSLLPFLNTDQGLLSRNIRQIQSKGDTLYISTEEGFQVFDPQLKLIAVLSASDGLLGKKIMDFVVDSKFVWFLDQTGLQRLSKSYFKQAARNNFPKLRAIQTFVNEEEIDPNNMNISYKDTDLTFKVIAPSLSFKDDLFYKYRLDEGSWRENPHELNIIPYGSLPPGDHVFEVDLIYKDGIIDSKSIKFIVATPYYFSWWFILGCISLFLVATYVFYNSRLKAQELRSQQLAELNTSKLTALQSQMNPHFIFNALNSIQEYIMLNERKLAGKYLGKFADLMRIYLNYSQTKSISLQEEIDALHLYLDLEKLRFEDLLTYSIEVDNKVDLGCMIPSLLIQPYVENALKHGLLHKEENRILAIEFVFNVQHNVIECHVNDNGIGRAKSFEINKDRNPQHKSFASGATKNRLKLLNHNLKVPIGEETIDLFNEDNSAAGTKVIISIPIMRK